MTNESRKILDDVNDLDVIEVHWLTSDGDERVSVGPYGGLRCSDCRVWWLRIVQRPSIRMNDVLEIRVLTLSNTGGPQ